MNSRELGKLNGVYEYWKEKMLQEFRSHKAHRNRAHSPYDRANTQRSELEIYSQISS